MQQPTITCKNCGHHFHGKYCSQCGEKVYGEKDKSLWHVVEELFHFISHFEGTLLTTLKAIFTKPGQFSFDYCNGVRKKYFKPISFFLLIVVLYLIFPLATGLNMRLSDHIHFWYGDYAKHAIISYMHKTNASEAIVFEHYTAVSEKVSKILLFLLIPVMAAFCALFLVKRKKTFFDHLIFSTETTSFFILWGFLIVPLIVRVVGMLTHITEGNTDIYVVPLITLIPAAYVFVAARRFYLFKPGKSILFSILFLAILSLFVHYIYSLILFFVTVQLLH